MPPVAWVTCVLLCLFLNAMLGVGWASLLSLGRKGTPSMKGILVAWESQVAKYLPGNVFHFVGRVVSARRFGVPTIEGSRATLLEVGILTGLGCALGLPVLWSSDYSWFLTAFLIVCVFLGLLLLPSIPLGKKLIPESLRSVKPKAGPTAWAVLAYLVVFLAQGAVFIILMNSLAPELGWRADEAIRIVAFAWLVGFVTIGAPGGLGVREAVFLSMAPDGMGGAVALCAAGLRLAGILGDLIAFLLSILINRLLRSLRIDLA